MDLISIIVPIYNVEKYLSRCIDSVVNQTYKNLEIILVDDGSRDGSSHICESYKEKDPRIKVIHQENSGLGFARNAGLDNASGSYVTFIDGDDYIGLTHIEKMHELIVATRTDTCIGGHTKKYKNFMKIHKNVCSGKIFYHDVKNQILPRMCGADNKGNDYIEMSVCMVLFSNEIIRSNHLRFVSEREFISEDLVFGFSYYPLSKGVCCSDISDYYYCDNEGSLTTKYREDRFLSEVKLYKEVLNKAKELKIEHLCKSRLDSTLIAIARYSIKLEEKFKHTIGEKIAKEHVRRICEEPLLVDVMNEYDDNNVKISTRFVNYLIRKRHIPLLILIMWVKNVLNV